MRYKVSKRRNTFFFGFGGNREYTEYTVCVLGGGEGDLKERGAYSKIVALEGGGLIERGA